MMELGRLALALPAKGEGGAGAPAFAQLGVGGKAAATALGSLLGKPGTKA